MPEKMYTITLTAQDMQTVFNILDQSVQSAGLGALQEIDKQLKAAQDADKKPELVESIPEGNFAKPPQ